MSNEPKPKNAHAMLKSLPLPPDILTDKKTSKVYYTGPWLGEGGFARCYHVKDINSNRLAAKVIAKVSYISNSNYKVNHQIQLKKVSLTSQKQKQKLVSEIKVHSSLSHPYIVKFISCFEDDANVYMILELCENKTFVDYVKKRRRLTEFETRFYVHQLLEALDYMHSHKVIHRDLKLGNLFLSKEMCMKIGDFGLAANLKHDGDRKRTICGTPNYIAPEVLFDAQNGHSYEVDIWSLGVIMYTLLIGLVDKPIFILFKGKPPFQTKEVNAIYQKIKENTYEFPDSVPLPADAKDLIQTLLHSRPECRPMAKDILNHDFIIYGFHPASIPEAALSFIPSFDNIVDLNANRKRALKISPLLPDTKPKVEMKPLGRINPQRAPIPGSWSSYERRNPLQPVDPLPLNPPNQSSSINPTLLKSSPSPTQLIQQSNDFKFKDFVQPNDSPRTSQSNNLNPNIKHKDIPKLSQYFISPNLVNSNTKQLNNTSNSKLSTNPTTINSKLATNPVNLNSKPPFQFQKPVINIDNRNQFEIKTQANITSHQNSRPHSENIDQNTNKVNLKHDIPYANPVSINSSPRMNKNERNEEIKNYSMRNSWRNEDKPRNQQQNPFNETKSDTLINKKPNIKSETTLKDKQSFNKNSLLFNESKKQTVLDKENIQDSKRADMYQSQSVIDKENINSSIKDNHQNIKSQIDSDKKTEIEQLVKQFNDHGLVSPNVSDILRRNTRSVEIMHQTITNALNSFKEGNLVLGDPCSESDMNVNFVTKWIDYSNKYGLGYQLRDGTMGVYFNDTTSIVLSCDGKVFEYLYGERNGNIQKVIREHHDMETYPKELRKKVTILKHFKKYMPDDGERKSSEKQNNFDYLSKYSRNRHGVVFRTSNHIFQINLFDHTKLILSKKGQIVTFIGKEREITYMTLNQALLARDVQLIERIKFAQELLSQVIDRKHE